MVAAPRNLRDDAKGLYERSELPESFAFFERLSPVNQRLFSRDLWQVLARACVEQSESSFREFAEFIEGWEATADLDSDPEAAEELRKPAVYRPFKVA